MYQRKPRNRYGRSQTNGNHVAFSPQFSNNVYFKGPNGWYYENKNKSISNKNWVPKNNFDKNDFQKERQVKQKFVQKQNI